MATAFHLALPIKNLIVTRSFYVDILDCRVGRKAQNWIDIDFFGNQLTFHENEPAVISSPFYKNSDNTFPVHHFGVILSWDKWHELEKKLKSLSMPFLIEPKIVFQGEVGEQKTMFIEDPNGYSIEFKSFQKSDSVFKS